jgi:uncharacterized protein with HEPN domain
MLDHSHEALALIKNKKRRDLDTDRVLSLALVRLLEIVGEAANRVSENAKKQRPEIPWSQIISLRNRLIHGYDSVDLDILWQILNEDVPSLIAKLQHTAEP